jgi:hypothetical protein
MDGVFTILRARMPDGGFREIKIYDQYANDEAAFEQITHVLREYTHPNAEPFVPRGTTLFIGLQNDVTDVQTIPWPLHPDILAFLNFNQ